MKIYAYDIWDGDKGIILAHDEMEAIKKIQEVYGEKQLIEGFNHDGYDSGICELHEVTANLEKVALYFL